MSLKEGRYQIGELEFGRGTPIVISGVEQVGYQVAPGDRPIPMSDELRFTKDYVQPGVIQFSIGIADNYMLFGTPPPGSNIQSGHLLAENFRREWRADEIRDQWGLCKPLTYKAAGYSRVLYGRPRDLAMDRLRTKPGWYNTTAAYQLADSLSYSSDYSSITFSQGSTETLARGDGEAPSWLRVIVLGPITNPVITLGPHVITAGTVEEPLVVPSGGFLEVNSYPWERRAILRTYIPEEEPTGSSLEEAFWANISYILRSIRNFLGIPAWRTRVATFIDGVLEDLIPGFDSNLVGVAAALNGEYSGGDVILQNLSALVAQIFGLNLPPATTVVPPNPTNPDWVMLNVGAKLVADSPYLEDLRIPAFDSWECGLQGSSGSAIALVQWQEAYHAI